MKNMEQLAREKKKQLEMCYDKAARKKGLVLATCVRFSPRERDTYTASPLPPFFECRLLGILRRYVRIFQVVRLRIQAKERKKERGGGGREI